jgi:transposase
LKRSKQWRIQDDEAGAAAIHPKIPLNVILLGDARGLISSRQIERACQENVIVINTSARPRGTQPAA